MKSKGCVPYTKIYNKASICVNELILTPFSPIDIKHKNLISYTLTLIFFRASRKASFSYFPKTACSQP